MNERSRLSRTAEIMGTVVSVHAIAAGSADPQAEARVAAAADAAFEDLRDAERVFSTFRPDSEISRLRDGSLDAALADPRIEEVRRACLRAETETSHRFSAAWRGWFDPTGYVKGWAAAGAFDRHLRSLLDEPAIAAVGINAGGDMQLATAASADWEWRVGIADPLRPGALLATVQLRNGAVATSGSAERGAHILDPRTGLAAHGAVSATVVAERLVDADVWATAAVVAGIEDLGWIGAAAHTRGVIVGADGRTRRWASGVEWAAADSAALDSAALGGVGIDGARHR